MKKYELTVKVSVSEELFYDGRDASSAAISAAEQASKLMRKAVWDKHLELREQHTVQA